MANQLTSAADIVSTVTGDQRLLLDPRVPLESAREFLRRKYLHELTRTLHHHQGVFYAWTGRHYEELSKDELRADVCRFLDGAQRIERGNYGPFNPAPRSIDDVIAMLKAETQLSAMTPPIWLDRQPRLPPKEFSACSNGLLHLPTGELHAHTPAFFNLHSVGYEFNPLAPLPGEWLAFLRSLWSDDDESISALQQIFGYLLTGETAQQKAFLLVGPPRSGKGTIARILAKLVGSENVAGPTMASLASEFGLAPLIGKPLAVMSDARVSGKMDNSIFIERLLSITGEDRLTINRKNRDHWTGTLSTRLIILTNEVPRLADASGALASRFILLRFKQDFRGREDHGLTDRLLLELPAILNWAIEGRAVLAAQGRFKQPPSAAQALEALEDLASPISAFLQERAVVGAEKQVECSRLFEAWRSWCVEQGRGFPGTVQTFGRDLQAALPTLRVVRPHTGDGRTRMYEGVGLRFTLVLPPGWAAPR